MPEVEITTRKLQPLRGKRIISFWSDWPRGLRVRRNAVVIDRDIKGRRILRIWRRGKVIFFGLGSKNGAPSPERLLAFHQRMSGSFGIVNSNGIGNSKWKTANRHVHAKLGFEDGTGLWFEDPRKFGVVWYGKPEEVMREKYIASLGPDALSISFPQFKAILKKHSGMIKSLLLRQDVFAGIGNIVADETLWRAKIHPRRPISDLKSPDFQKLFRSLKDTLRLAIHTQGTTLRNWGHPDGKRGGFQEHFRVYDRKDEKCFRCQTKIIRTVIGGRGTWICPKCQRL